MIIPTTMIIQTKNKRKLISFDEEAQRDSFDEDNDRPPLDEIYIPSKGSGCMLRLFAFVIMITTAMGPSVRFIGHTLDNNNTFKIITDNNGNDQNHGVDHRYYRDSPEITDNRTFNVILNYRVEARIVGINDYGDSERIFGFSERFVNVATGEEAVGDRDIIELHGVDPKFAHLTIRSLTPEQVCDYQYSLRVLMDQGFGTTNEFQTITTCSNDGLTYTIMVQVSIIENESRRRATGKSYDIHFMNHIFEHQYDDADGWYRVESSNTYRVRRLSAGDTVLDPLEPEYKTITLLEDGKCSNSRFDLTKYQKVTDEIHELLYRTKLCHHCHCL